MKQDIQNPHDKLFKETWSNIESARDFFSNYLPDKILANIDLTTLKIRKDSFIDKDFREFYSDLLYSATLKGRKSYFYLLMEHKSSFEKQTPLKLLQYMVKIWHLHLEQEGFPLPVIIPVVLYHGVQKWTIGSEFLSLLDDSAKELKEYCPNFCYVLNDLSEYTDEQIKGKTLGRVVLLLLKYVFQPGYDEKIPEILRLISSVISKETGLEAIESLLRYILGTTEKSKEELKEITSKCLPETEENIIMKLAERLMLKGKLEGKQEGKLEGIQENIFDILQMRFSEIPEAFKHRLNKIKNFERLRVIHKQAVVINSFDELQTVLDS